MDFQLRQGDVLIMAVDSIKGKKQARENGKIILALGESHTHCHAIADKDTNLYTDATRKFLEVCLEKGATLKVESIGTDTPTHPRHLPLIVPKGTHEVIIQKQWDYMKQLSQQVRD